MNETLIASTQPMRESDSLEVYTPPEESRIYNATSNTEQIISEFALSSNDSPTTEVVITPASVRRSSRLSLKSKITPVEAELMKRRRSALRKRKTQSPGRDEHERTISPPEIAATKLTWSSDLIRFSSGDKRQKTPFTSPVKPDKRADRTEERLMSVSLKLSNGKASPMKVRSPSPNFGPSPCKRKLNMDVGDSWLGPRFSIDDDVNTSEAMEDFLKRSSSLPREVDFLEGGGGDSSQLVIRDSVFKNITTRTGRLYSEAREMDSVMASYESSGTSGEADSVGDGLNETFTVEEEGKPHEQTDQTAISTPPVTPNPKSALKGGCGASTAKKCVKLSHVCNVKHFQWHEPSTAVVMQESIQEETNYGCDGSFSDGDSEVKGKKKKESPEPPLPLSRSSGMKKFFPSPNLKKLMNNAAFVTSSVQKNLFPSPKKAGGEVYATRGERIVMASRLPQAKIKMAVSPLKAEAKETMARIMERDKDKRRTKIPVMSSAAGMKAVAVKISNNAAGCNAVSKVQPVVKTTEEAGGKEVGSVRNMAMEVVGGSIGKTGMKSKAALLTLGGSADNLVSKAAVKIRGSSLVQRKMTFPKSTGVKIKGVCESTCDSDSELAFELPAEEPTAVKIPAVGVSGRVRITRMEVRDLELPSESSASDIPVGSECEKLAGIEINGIGESVGIMENVGLPSPLPAAETDSKMPTEGTSSNLSTEGLASKTAMGEGSPAACNKFRKVDSGSKPRIKCSNSKAFPDVATNFLKSNADNAVPMKEPAPVGGISLIVPASPDLAISSVLASNAATASISAPDAITPEVAAIIPTMVQAVREHHSMSHAAPDSATPSKRRKSLLDAVSRESESSPTFIVLANARVKATPPPPPPSVVSGKCEIAGKRQRVMDGKTPKTAIRIRHQFDSSYCSPASNYKGRKHTCVTRMSPMTPSTAAPPTRMMASSSKKFGLGRRGIPVPGIARGLDTRKYDKIEKLEGKTTNADAVATVAIVSDNNYSPTNLPEDEPNGNSEESAVAQQKQLDVEMQADNVDVGSEIGNLFNAEMEIPDMGFVPGAADKALLSLSGAEDSFKCSNGIPRDWDNIARLQRRESECRDVGVPKECEDGVRISLNLSDSSAATVEEEIVDLRVANITEDRSENFDLDKVEFPEGEEFLAASSDDAAWEEGVEIVAAMENDDGKEDEAAEMAGGGIDNMASPKERDSIAGGGEGMAEEEIVMGEVSASIRVVSMKGGSEIDEVSPPSVMIVEEASPLAVYKFSGLAEKAKAGLEGRDGTPKRYECGQKSPWKERLRNSLERLPKVLCVSPCCANVGITDRRSYKPLPSATMMKTSRRNLSLQMTPVAAVSAAARKESDDDDSLSPESRANSVLLLSGCCEEAVVEMEMTEYSVAGGDVTRPNESGLPEVLDVDEITLQANGEQFGNESADEDVPEIAESERADEGIQGAGVFDNMGEACRDMSGCTDGINAVVDCRENPPVAIQKSPVSSYENVEGVKKLMTTPKEVKNSYEDVTGMKRLLTTPKPDPSSYLDVEGVDLLMRTPPPLVVTAENAEGKDVIRKRVHKKKRIVDTTPRKLRSRRKGEMGDEKMESDQNREEGKKAAIPEVLADQMAMVVEYPAVSEQVTVDSKKYAVLEQAAATVSEKHATIWEQVPLVVEHSAAILEKPLVTSEEYTGVQKPIETPAAVTEEMPVFVPKGVPLTLSPIPRTKGLILDIRPTTRGSQVCIEWNVDAGFRIVDKFVSGSPSSFPTITIGDDICDSPSERKMRRVTFSSNPPEVQEVSSTQDEEEMLQTVVAKEEVLVVKKKRKSILRAASPALSDQAVISAAAPEGGNEATVSGGGRRKRGGRIAKQAIVDSVAVVTRKRSKPSAFTCGERQLVPKKRRESVSEKTPLTVIDEEREEEEEEKTKEEAATTTDVKKAAAKKRCVVAQKVVTSTTTSDMDQQLQGQSATGKSRRSVRVKNAKEAVVAADGNREKEPAATDDDDEKKKKPVRWSKRRSNAVGIISKVISPPKPKVAAVKKRSSKALVAAAEESAAVKAVSSEEPAKKKKAVVAEILRTASPSSRKEEAVAAAKKKTAIKDKVKEDGGGNRKSALASSVAAMMRRSRGKKSAAGDDGKAPRKSLGIHVKEDDGGGKRGRKKSVVAAVLKVRKSKGKNDGGGVGKGDRQKGKIMDQKMTLSPRKTRSRAIKGGSKG